MENMENMYFDITFPFGNGNRCIFVVKKSNILQNYIINKRLSKEILDKCVLENLAEYISDKHPDICMTLNDRNDRPYLFIHNSDKIKLVNESSMEFFKKIIVPECNLNLKSLILYKMNQDENFKIKAFVSWYQCNPDAYSDFDNMYERIKLIGRL